jgi:hypothetical protein
MKPSDFRKVKALDHASLYAKQARRAIREAYAADPNIDRRRKLDEVMVALQEYEDVLCIEANEAYEKLTKDQT